MPDVILFKGGTFPWGGGALLSVDDAAAAPTLEGEPAVLREEEEVPGALEEAGTEAVGTEASEGVDCGVGLLGSACLLISLPCRGCSGS